MSYLAIPYNRHITPAFMLGILLIMIAAIVSSGKLTVLLISDTYPSLHARGIAYLRNRPALAVHCCVIIHCLEVSCKEDQITSAQRK